eukprot:TRINITY_DN50022_c0_g1_i1.p1 TRINITY_DN50022_c0_g1~~TRINITY_DN50022_c0_g1_i1.p1  ORF type:complete len:321 (-),score=48.30 TRINITY_DN50022_c0_g1_i1:39-1001(-)
MVVNTSVRCSASGIDRSKWQLAALAAAAASAGAAAGVWLAHRRRHDGEAVLRQLARHTSIRKYANRPVPRELLQLVLQCGFRASNGGNMQTYSVIITSDADARAALAVIHDNESIKNAPLLLTFCADWLRMQRWCDLRGAKPNYDNFMAFITGNNDAMVAAQNIALAAEACGLGICYLGSTTWATARLCEFFHLPRHVHPVTSMTVGWPDENPPLRARLPTNGIIHQETYTALSDAELLQVYSSREIEGWNRYLQLYGRQWKEKIEQHGLENLAQVYTTLKYTARDFRRWSRGMLASLATQGFGDNAAKPGDEVPGALNL